jgi:asparagine synthase (glutamine-hydrolysing)
VCGIAGFYDYKNILQQGHFEYLMNAEKQLKHRGPDGYGFWVSDDKRVSFVHRRLSIQDLSVAGRQPFISDDGQIVITFNGELYNHRALKKELETRGYVYRSTTDTETLLFAYQEWGIKCLDNLDGMFAFALFDARTNDFYLVRDRVGIKPLYLSLQGERVSFASEIKAFRAFPWMSHTVSSQAIYHYLSFMVAPAPYTIFKDIYKLPAGYYMHCTAAGAVNFERWYNPLTNIEQIDDEDDAVERLEYLLRTSVKQHMLSDRPVGAFLSAGIDSSLIVGLMAESGADLKTFTVGYDGDESIADERGGARKIAEYFGTEHHEIGINEQQAFAWYQKMVEQLDEPHADPVSIPFYYVAKLAKEQGVSVVQVGEGADELFLGYELYQQYYRLDKCGWNFWGRVLGSGVKKKLFQAARPLLSQSSNYVELGHNWAHDRSFFWSGALPFNEFQKQQLYGAVPHDDDEPDEVVQKMLPGCASGYDSHAFVDYWLNDLRKHVHKPTLTQQMLYLESRQRLPELLLMRADKMAMAVGVEARVPYLDHKILEFALGLSPSLTIGWHTTKYLLRRVAERVVPRHLINKKKIGFAAPIMKWLQSGDYFKSYYRSIAPSVNQLFRGASVAGVNNSCRVSQPQAAVQKWVLQQLASFVKHY